MTEMDFEHTTDAPFHEAMTGDVDVNMHGAAQMSDEEYASDDALDEMKLEPEAEVALAKVRKALGELTSKLDTMQEHVRAQAARIAGARWMAVCALRQLEAAKLEAIANRLNYDIGLVGEELFRQLCALDAVQGTRAARPLRRAAVAEVEQQIERSDALRRRVAQQTILLHATLPHRDGSIAAKNAKKRLSPDESRTLANVALKKARAAAKAAAAAATNAPTANTKPSRSAPSQSQPSVTTRVLPDRAGVELFVRLPGTQRSDISIAADDAHRVLVITTPTFHREFETPEWVNANSVTARFDDASETLHVMLPTRHHVYRSPASHAAAKSAMPHRRAAAAAYTPPRMSNTPGFFGLHPRRVGGIFW